MRYPHHEVETKWRKFWEDNEVYKTDMTEEEKRIYSLVMFIYPSGSKLHCGHWYNYGPADSWTRFKKLQGYNVFSPFGYDAFGLPAENYAIKTGVHPYDSTMKNIEDIRKMVKDMGCMYDWDKELMTCVPEYYKWSQWLFVKLFEKGLAYRKETPVNWDPVDQTVLANEQVLADGTAERSGAVVEKKLLAQWNWKITEYADELLDGLEKINWPEKTKTMQKNWIGRSYGTEVVFDVEGHDEQIKVFTTRPDTLFGVTYVVVAPESPLVDVLVTDEYKQAVEKYIADVKDLSEIDRTSTTKEKTGVPTGSFAINPVNGEKVPVWVGDYVLATYGTGCVMAVPAHDERDFEFAKKFELPIVKVILEPDTKPEDELEAAYTDPGTMINSGKFDGTDSVEGKDKVTEYLEELNKGSKQVNYRLRDWLVSRQRYWGTPIPIVHCEDCGEVAVPEDQLPVELPYDVDFSLGSGSPLARHEGFMNTKCPKCGKDAKRDPDTMDTFVCSSWYYLRYLNPHYSEGMFDSELANKWTPVDMYVGGAEHATMHLLYARFVHKFLRDIGMVNSDEPFQTLVHQGTITNAGAKMSKSKGNVVNPDEFIVDYGADVFRMYLMFMGPYELGGDWSDKGIVGVDRFANKVYQLYVDSKDLAKQTKSKEKYELAELNDAEKAIYRKVNLTLEKYSEEIDNLRFNTAIAALMELSNEMNKNWNGCREDLKLYALERFGSMIAPVAPHLGEECWQLLGKDASIYQKPVYYDVDKDALVVDSVLVVVQVNGKVRAKIEVPADSEQDVVKPMVFADDKVKSYTDGKTIVKEIYVKNRIYNIVVK